MAYSLMKDFWKLFGGCDQIVTWDPGSGASAWSPYFRAALSQYELLWGTVVRYSGLLGLFGRHHDKSFDQGSCGLKACRLR